MNQQTKATMPMMYVTIAAGIIQISRSPTVSLLRPSSSGAKFTRVG